MLKIERRIIDWDLKKDLRCFFCGSKRSVKYIVHHEGCLVNCCNKCVLTRTEGQK